MLGYSNDNGGVWDRRVSIIWIRGRIMVSYHICGGTLPGYLINIKAFGDAVRQYAPCDDPVSAGTQAGKIDAFYLIGPLRRASASPGGT